MYEAKNLTFVSIDYVNSTFFFKKLLIGVSCYLTVNFSPRTKFPVVLT